MTNPGVRTRKKLIETALPLDDINRAAAREKSIRHGHPSTLHLWWARRPLAAARAVLFAQLVDDPSARPELWPTRAKQDLERETLFGILRDLVLWKNTTNEAVLERAREAIRASWRRACADNAEHPRAKELFDPERLPAFHDPFAGGGAIPLEAQRLGLEAHASDLNPVAVLINKAMIEFPPRFAGKAPVNPEWRTKRGRQTTARRWKGAEGLAEDIRHYGKWMRDEAERRIGHLYPKARIAPELVRERPDLERYEGRELPVIAWLWARTVPSPNPAFREVEVPLISTFFLSTKKGKQAYVEPVVEGRSYRFNVRVGPPPDPDAAKKGTKLARGANFRCLVSGVPIPPGHLKEAGKAGRMGSRLLAVVAAGDRGRVYLPPSEEMEEAARAGKPAWRPDGQVPPRLTGGTCVPYGMTEWADLFTARQLVALTTLSDLVGEARERVRRDALTSTQETNGRPLRDGGAGPAAYAEAVSAYLGLSVSRQANRTSSLNFWDPLGANIQQVFARQALGMVWDFAESNPLGESSGSFLGQFGYLTKVLEHVCPARTLGTGIPADARNWRASRHRILSTDPPYYDNIAYADLSDFFHVWLRHSLKPILPDLFATLTAPKGDELVAAAHRHGGRAKARAFFLNGITRALERLAENSHSAFPVSIYYAFKQAETQEDGGTASTGWETFLDAVIRSGFSVTGTWPMRTELTGNLKKQVNALASSIVLVCRKRPADAPPSTRRAFLQALENELPEAVARLQAGNIAPVDLAQAAIGPGMAIFSRASAVVEADDTPMTVRQALALINAALDHALSKQDARYDPWTRFAVSWFETKGLEEGAYGEAETLATARGVAVSGVVEAGILEAKGGKVRLLRRDELDPGWAPARDARPTVWEAAQHVARRVFEEGELPAAELISRLGELGSGAQALAYRLYGVSERLGLAEESLVWNELVKIWPRLLEQAPEAAAPRPGSLHGARPPPPDEA